MFIRICLAALLLTLGKASAQTPPQDALTLIRAQILQHWFAYPDNSNYPVSFAADFDLNRDGSVVGRPKIIAHSNFSMPPSIGSIEEAIEDAQPFLMLEPQDYESWKHISTTFKPGDKSATDIYASTKKDILGLTTGMIELDAIKLLQNQGCRPLKRKEQMVECAIDAKQSFRVKFTTNLSPNVAFAIEYVFPGLVGREMVNSISAQFRTRRWHQHWFLGTDLKMDIALIADNHRDAPIWQLSMIQERLVADDRDALDAYQRSISPKPKF